MFHDGRPFVSTVAQHIVFRERVHGRQTSGYAKSAACHHARVKHGRIRLARDPGKIGHFPCSLIEYYRGACDAAWSIRMMSPVKTLIPATALALVAQLTVAFADGVPHYNLAPLCRGIVAQGGRRL